MHTSKKHREFVSEPIGSKRVTTIPGIGDTLGQRLNEKGYDRADKVLGQYLVMGRDKDQFKTWMRDTCGANDKQAAATFKSLDDYRKDFM